MAGIVAPASSNGVGAAHAFVDKEVSVESILLKASPRFSALRIPSHDLQFG